MTPLEHTCSDNISSNCLCLFRLPSWRQCYLLYGHYFPASVLMANLSKLAHLDPQTTGQPRLEPEHSLQHGCLMRRSQQRRMASCWRIYPRMPNWFAVIPYTPLVFETQTPPHSQCKEGKFAVKHEILGASIITLQGSVAVLTWREIISDGSCQWARCLIHFLSSFQKLPAPIALGQSKAHSRQNPRKLRDRPLLKSHPSIAIIDNNIPGAYHNTCSMGICLGWPESFPQWMEIKKPILLVSSMFSLLVLAWQLHSLPRSFPAQTPGSLCLGDMPLQLKTSVIIIKQAMRFRERANCTAKPAPAEPSCGNNVVWDFPLQSYP